MHLDRVVAVRRRAYDKEVIIKISVVLGQASGRCLRICFTDEVHILV